MKFLMMAALAVLGLSASARAMDGMAAEVGKPAPDFSAKDIMGVDVKLSYLKGRVVVLEWTNHECPYVRKQYDSGNMQALQKEMTDKGVVWVSVVSSAQGKEGYTTPEEANSIVEQQGAHPTHKILDTDGVIGHLYGAKTTPHMFVIDKDSVLAYAGAIDSDSSFKPDSIATAKNYVRAAIDDLMAGRPVETASTNSYGCGVKY
ncbi:MAG TPA: redoxin domain-containing protein [Alphaproteobacteria bacterium]|nr:redoxin domain-containing protein [Alphaproteobacteria bacterium]HNS44819.1 redoxin domain-containing protein [Alphaproteobacteria bacterium]